MELLRMIATEQQAVCIVGLLALSLVPPFWAAARARKAEQSSRDWIRAVWIGQIIMAMSGLTMIVMPRFAFAALLFAVVVCAVFALRLQRQLRAPMISAN